MQSKKGSAGTPAPKDVRHFESLKDSGRHTTWFRGNQTKRAPDQARLTSASAVEDWVLDGWLPDAPMIDRDTTVTAFGSCFAANISAWLSERNYRVSKDMESAKDAYVVRMGEGMVNSFVIRQQFEWAWENKIEETPLWHGYNAESFGYDPEVQRQTKALFDATDVFILTLGLSEIWYDEVSGGVFWRTLPKEHYDPSRHKFRISSVEENRENIDAIYQLIRKHRPDAKVIFTLSPIPLVASFRDVSCVSANSVSKAVLRVAIDEVMRKYRDEGHIFYWPSYEIIMDVFGAPFKSDRRHLPKDVLNYVMMQFEQAWCVDEGDRNSLIEQWIHAKVAAGMLPSGLSWAVNKRNGERVRKIADRLSQDEDLKLAHANKKLFDQLLASWGEGIAAE